MIMCARYVYINSQHLYNVKVPSMALFRAVGHETSANKIFTLRACSRVVAAKPSHRAYAAKEKGSAGPVRRRRENGTLDEISCGGSLHSASELSRIGGGSCINLLKM